MQPVPILPAAESGRKKRVLLVDDHAVVRAGLATLINEESDLVACGEADNEPTALESVRQLQPDVAVVDWSLGNRDAAALVETLHQDHPGMPVLVLSIHDEVFYAERAIRAGASGYVMKQEATEKIVEAIRCVAAGRPYLSERAAQTVTDLPRERLGGIEFPPPKPDRRSGTASSADGRLPQTSAPSPGEVAPSVSIVIPVYNSETTIKRLVSQLIVELDPLYRLQIILVDDGSSDQSAAACQRLHRRHPDQVDFVMLAKNFGEHNAVMAGLNCADGDYSVIMDDDFQNPPSEVVNLIEEIRKGHDVVYVRYAAKHHSWFRNFGSRFHNWMATRALGKPAELYLSSFKAVSRFVVHEIVRYTGPAPYLDAIILRTTRRIGVVPARHEPRRNGKSGYTFGKLVSLWGNMIVAFSLYPVRLLGLFGLVAMLVGGGYGLYTVIAYLTPLIDDPDPIERLNASLWFFRGVQLLFIAIVAEYVGRIYMQLNRDPQFIVRSVLRHRPRT